MLTIIACRRSLWEVLSHHRDVASAQNQFPSTKFQARNKHLRLIQEIVFVQISARLTMVAAEMPYVRLAPSVIALMGIDSWMESVKVRTIHLHLGSLLKNSIFFDTTHTRFETK